MRTTGWKGVAMLRNGCSLLSTRLAAASVVFHHTQHGNSWWSSISSSEAHRLCHTTTGGHQPHDLYSEDEQVVDHQQVLQQIIRKTHAAEVRRSAADTSMA